MARIAAVGIAILGFVTSLRSETPEFERRVLTEKYFCDGVTSGDLNRDGKADIVAGPYWYAGPKFDKAREIYPAKPFPLPPSPTNSMYSFVYDFNGDGWNDVLRLGRVHKHAAVWFENPKGAEGHWKSHFVFERVKGESPTLVDVDGDLRPEVVCHDGKRWGWIEPNWSEPTNSWTFHAITPESNYPQFYHGTGVGDVNGDGRLDLLLNHGWWEQPENARDELWKFHDFKFGTRGGAQMFAYDVDGDGDNDVITSIDAHGWGLSWYEQVRNPDQTISFHERVIMGTRQQEKEYGVAFSQPHAIALADVDGDGRKDIVTGKRRWAHGPKGDIEPNAAPVVYAFLLRRENGRARFEPQLIDDASGTGVQITAADVTGDGRVDVLTASKLGTFLFLRKPPKHESRTRP